MRISLQRKLASSSKTTQICNGRLFISVFSRSGYSCRGDAAVLEVFMVCGCAASMPKDRFALRDRIEFQTLWHRVSFHDFNPSLSTPFQALKIDSNSEIACTTSSAVAISLA